MQVISIMLTYTLVNNKTLVLKYTITSRYIHHNITIYVHYITYINNSTLKYQYITHFYTPNK